MHRYPQLDLGSLLTEQNPEIDLRLKIYETSTRNFLKAVVNYKSRAVVLLTERRNQQVAEKKRLADRIQAVDNETNQCKLREIELLAELEKEQGERKASEHAVSTLKRHLTSVREKCRTFDVEVEQYRAVKANLSREKEKERRTLQLRANAITPELDVCQQRLRCVVEGIEKHQILVRFTHVDAQDHSREFSLVVDVSGQIYKVLTSSPPLPTLPILIAELNQSRDIYAFIRRVRLAFVRLVQPSTS